MKSGTTWITLICVSRIHTTREDSSGANRRWCALCSIPSSLDRRGVDANSYCRDAFAIRMTTTASGGEMATGMGFFQRLFSPVSARTELLEELSVLTGRDQGLIERLKRHAPLTSSNIRTGVEALAEKEAGHVKGLHSILADHNVWPDLP